MRQTFLLMCCVFLVLLYSCAEISNELRGTAKPEGGTNETVAPSKTYAANHDKVWQSVRKVLDAQGYIYSADKSSGSIKTEPKYLNDPSKFRFLGSDYKAKLFLTVSGSMVTFKARFDKSSNLVGSSQDREYLEKENQLRKMFFEELDKLLKTNGATPVDASPSDKQGGSRADAAKKYGYRGQHDEIFTETPVLSPAVARPGENMRYELQYAVLSPQKDKRFIVSEVVVLSGGGETIGLAQRQTEKPQGTHISTMQFDIPKDLVPGTYKIITTLSSGNLKKTVHGEFVVRR